MKSKKNKLKIIKRQRKKHILSVGKLVKPVNFVMDSTEIIIFFNYFLFNYMITKIDDCEIKYQSNIKMFF